MPFVLIRDEEEFGCRVRALYVRQSHAGGAEFALTLYEQLVRIYGVRHVAFNAQSGLVNSAARPCSSTS